MSATTPEAPTFRRGARFTKRHWSVRLAAALALGVASAASPTSTLGALGDLDPTFGTAGRMQVGFGDGHDWGNAVARQPDGKLVVAGSSSNSYAIQVCMVRYNADGSLDTAFGNGGKARAPYALGTGASSVALQADGNILIGGLFDFRIRVMRFDSVGKLDPSFGEGGVVTAPKGLNYFSPVLLAVQSDGKIVAACGNNWPQFEYFAVARFESNGAPDSSFGGDGIVASAGFTAITLRAMRIQSDGKIVLAGASRDHGGGAYHTTVVRYNANGTLDSTFGGGDGVVKSVIGSSSEATSVAFHVSLTQFKIVVAGWSERAGSGRDVTIVRYLADGTPDATLGTGGIVFTPISTGMDAASSIALPGNAQGPTRILVAGSAEAPNGYVDLLAARYLLDGTLDPAFGGDGIAIAAISAGDEFGNGMVYSNGQAVVAGFVRASASNPSDDFLIARFNSNGALDTTFDGDGFRTDDVGDSGAAAFSVALQNDGKIVIGGSHYVPIGSDVFALARCNVDGALDASFGVDGCVKISVGTGADAIEDVDIQDDGKIVAVGTTSPGASVDIALVRCNADGSLDSSFSDDGKVVTSIAAFDLKGNAVLVQPDGRILVAGTAYSPTRVQVTVLRYLPDGSSDGSFGSGGIALPVMPVPYSRALDLALQPDGKIIVVGDAVGRSSYDALAMRLHANGAVDASFGGDGIVTTANDAGEVANAVAIQSDGGIVVAGSSQVDASAYLDFMLLRFNPDGSPDATFSADGEGVTAMGAGDDAAFDVAIEFDGSIVVSGGVADGFGPSDFVLARYQANGALDSAYGSGGISRIDFDGGYDASRALALDAESRAVAVGYAFGQFAGVRVLGGDPSTSVGVTIARPEEFHVGVPYPNPTREGVALSIELDAQDWVTARVVDVAGRRVRTVSGALRMGPGTHMLSWDGRDDGGAAVASGVYFLQVQGKNSTRARRVTILRSGK